MYGRRHMADGEAELEQLLRRVDDAGREASGRESMDVASAQEMWRAIPQDVKQQLFAMAKEFWTARDVYLRLMVAYAYPLMLRGMTPLPALSRAAAQLGIPRRDGARGTQPGMSQTQVSQYHRRQQQRGRVPGRGFNPRVRQREAEAWSEARPTTNGEAELEQLLESMDKAIDEGIGLRRRRARAQQQATGVGTKNRHAPAEHTSNASPSKKAKHQKGQRRKGIDKGGEKGDARRPYQREYEM